MACNAKSATVSTPDNEPQVRRAEFIFDYIEGETMKSGGASDRKKSTASAVELTASDFSFTQAKHGRSKTKHLIAIDFHSTSNLVHLMIRFDLVLFLPKLLNFQKVPSFQDDSTAEEALLHQDEYVLSVGLRSISAHARNAQTGLIGAKASMHSSSR